MGETWKQAIVSTMEEHGPVMTLSEIYQQMTNHPLVTPYHLERWKPGGQPRYQCCIRRRLTDLVNEGTVERLDTATYNLKGKR